jgi:protein TonB
MGHAAPVLEPPVAAIKRGRPAATFRFESLVLTEPESHAARRSATLLTSILIHAVLATVIVVVPILLYNSLPEPGDGVRAFFVAPADIPPPPPPPPPPAAGSRVTRVPAAPRPVEPSAFVAPIEIPEAIVPEEGLDLGVEGGVPGGVEGGVPGGVLGGVVGGLAQAAPEPPRVRVGGAIVAPKLLHRVSPEYPQLAAQARVQGLVILEAIVGIDGRVKSARVLRGQPLFDAAAIEAVNQWRYAPLLLNGVPTEFVLTVTVQFNLVGGTGS